MVKIFRFLSLVSACAALTACATISGVKSDSAMPAQSDVTPVSTDQLPAQTLNIGECALFVWGADSQKRFLLFSNHSQDYALWHDGVTTHNLGLGLNAGEPAYEQFARQDYITSNGASLSLDLQAPEPIETGMRYKAGRLTVTQADGWQRIIPVIGLASCKAI